MYMLGAMLCAVGFVSAIVVGMLDKYGVKQLGQDIALQQDSKKLVNFTLSHFCDLHVIACYIRQDLEKMAINAAMPFKATLPSTYSQ